MLDDKSRKLFCAWEKSLCRLEQGSEAQPRFVLV
jgi:hypothetical protein